MLGKQKRLLLADGKISPLEQLNLLRLLSGGGGVDAAEKRFLCELKSELRAASPELDSLCALMQD